MSATLHCIGCGKVDGPHAGDWRCGECGDLLEARYPGWTTAHINEWKIRWRTRRESLDPVDQSGVWRYRELLPILKDVHAAVTIREGNTPLYELTRCGKPAGLPRLFAKHLGMNPTGSFKDGGMTAAVSMAQESGAEWVACASTGNTSASMAAYAARAGLRALVLIPEGQIAWGKLAQTMDYGALICQLPTDFDGCVRVLGEIVQQRPIYLVNSVNPFRLEGQKTAAVEILEQLNWAVPEHVIIPGGNLANSSAIGKGFLEMRHLGLIPRLPRISIIQAEGANPLVRTIREKEGRELVTVKAETQATAIRIGAPASWKKAIRVLEATGGECLDVSEAEIALAKAEIGEDGIGCEPASAVTLAGAKKLARRGFIAAEALTVLILTGHSLKDSEYTIRLHKGELLPEKDSGALESHRHSPWKCEASADAVLKTLEFAG